MKKSAFAVLGAFVALAASAAPVQAQEFFGQDNNWASTFVGTNSIGAESDFLAALSGDVGTEDFESQLIGDTPPILLTFPGAGTASLTGEGVIDDETNSGSETNGRIAFSGSQYYEVNTDAGQESFGILFSEDIAAFGFYGIDVGDFGAQLTIDFYDEFDNLVHSWVPPHGLGSTPKGSPSQVANEGNLNYFGYINTANPFRRIQFTSANAGVDNWAFDDMTIAVPEQVIETVPEPATMTLLATGLAGMAAARRRKNKQA
jgi:hypothetical protein